MVVGGDLWRPVVQPQNMTSLVVPKCSPLLCLHALTPGSLCAPLAKLGVPLTTGGRVLCTSWISPLVSTVDKLCLVLIWQELKKCELKFCHHLSSRSSPQILEYLLCGVVSGVFSNHILSYLNYSVDTSSLERLFHNLICLTVKEISS